MDGNRDVIESNLNSNILNGVTRGEHAESTGSSGIKRPFPCSIVFQGPTSIYDPILTTKLANRPVEKKIRKAADNKFLRTFTPQVQFLITQDLNEERLVNHKLRIDEINSLISPYGYDLLDIYFTTVNPYYPIIDEPRFMRQNRLLPYEISSSLLAIMYSIALKWSSYSSKTASLSREQSIELSDKLQKMATRYFWENVECGSSNLTLIQSGLLILFSRDKPTSNDWTLVSILVNTAENLGLNINCSNWNIPYWEKNVRIRLAWCLWFQENWIALQESRSPYFKLGINWFVPMLVDNNLVEISCQNNIQPGDERLNISLHANEFQVAQEFFKCNVSLTIILNDILNTFYAPNAKFNYYYSDNPNIQLPLEQVLKTAKPLQLRLRNWYQGLPKSLLMINFKPGKFTPNGTLTLNYFAVELTLHRQIILSISEDSSNNLIDICRIASKARLNSAIKFLGELRNEHKRSFWFSNTVYNMELISIFASILYLTSMNREEEDFYKKLINEYLQILKNDDKLTNRKQIVLECIEKYLYQVIPALVEDRDNEIATSYKSSDNNNSTKELFSLSTRASSIPTITQDTASLKGIGLDIRDELTSQDLAEINSLSKLEEVYFNKTPQEEV